MNKKNLLNWIPAIFIMLAIFFLSSQPSDNLPDFDWADKIAKKGGHMLGYALLSLSYWYAFTWKKENRWLAWILSILYAMTDEIHQSFVPGRNPSPLDILVFDNFGALISLWLASRYRKQNDQK